MRDMQIRIANENAKLIDNRTDCQRYDRERDTFEL